MSKVVAGTVGHIHRHCGALHQQGLLSRCASWQFRSAIGQLTLQHSLQGTPIRRTFHKGEHWHPHYDAAAAKQAARSLRRSSTTPHDIPNYALGGINDESFKVTEVLYNSGRRNTIYLPPAAILKRTSILPRDLVSLNLTSRQEHLYPPITNESSGGSKTASSGVERMGIDRGMEYHHGSGGRRQAPQRHRRRRRRTFQARPSTAILPRTDCILLSFGNVRAVAGKDSVYIFDAHSLVAKNFARDLSEVFTTDTSGDPPELLFLEAVLRDTVDTFTRRIRLFEPIVDDFLDRVSNEVFSYAGVHQLVPLKDSLQSFELQVKQSFDCLTDLLNDDDLMLDLLLSEQEEARQKGIEVDYERHEYVELMLSVYSRQMQTLMQEIQYLLGRLQSKQEFVTLALAGYRNRLVRTNINLTIMGVSTGITTAMTGLFGMNLINGLEESPVAFAYVVGGSATVAILVASLSFSFIRGRLMQERAEQHLRDIEVFTSALSDMVALDYTVRQMMEGEGNMDKDEFKEKLVSARMTQSASDREVDFLFGALDTQKDNQLTADDFPMKR